MANQIHQAPQPHAPLPDDLLHMFRKFGSIHTSTTPDSCIGARTGLDEVPSLSSTVAKEQIVGLPGGSLVPTVESEEAGTRGLNYMTLPMDPNFTSLGNSFSPSATSSYLHQEHNVWGNSGNPSTVFIPNSSKEYFPITPMNLTDYQPISNMGNIESMGEAPLYQYPTALQGTNCIKNLDNGVMGWPYVWQSAEPNSSNGIELYSDVESFFCKLNYLRGWSHQQFVRLVSDDLNLLHELQGDDIVLMSRHQLGTHYLKKVLTCGNITSTNKIFEATFAHLVDIMKEQYGSHLFQKLLEFCNDKQLHLIVCSIAIQQKKFILGVTNAYGTRSIQKLVLTLKRMCPHLLEYMMLALAPAFKYLLFSRYGIHMIKHCLKHLTNKQNKFLYEATIENCLELAIDEWGCISLNCIIESIGNPLREELLKKISKNAVCLAQDPFGNYTVQNVLNLQHPMITSMICTELRGSYVRLSMQKCGSHVVEKCITSIAVRSVAKDLLYQGSDKLVQLARDQYGNYVIQTLLKNTKGRCTELYQKLVNVLSRHLNTLQNHPNGRNVFNLLADETLVSAA